MFSKLSIMIILLNKAHPRLGQSLLSDPRLVYQRQWYLQLCLCWSGYKRTPVTCRKEQGIVSRWQASTFQC